MAARKDEQLCDSGGMVDTAVMQNAEHLISLTARYANRNRYIAGSSPACRNICQGSSVKKSASFERREQQVHLDRASARSRRSLVQVQPLTPYTAVVKWLNTAAP